MKQASTSGGVEFQMGTTPCSPRTTSTTTCWKRSRTSASSTPKATGLPDWQPGQAGHVDPVPDRPHAGRIRHATHIYNYLNKGGIIPDRSSSYIDLSNTDLSKGYDYNALILATPDARTPTTSATGWPTSSRKAPAATSRSSSCSRRGSSAARERGLRPPSPFVRGRLAGPDSRAYLKFYLTRCTDLWDGFGRERQRPVIEGYPSITNRGRSMILV